MRSSPPRFDNQEDDGGEDDEHIGAKESGEHVHLPPEDGTIGLESLGHDPALLISGAIARRRCTYRGGELPDVDHTELQHIGRDAWQMEIEVLFHPCQAILQREYLVADDTTQEFDNGHRKRGAVKHGMYTVLDLCVELHDGAVNRVRRGVGEPKEVVIHGRGGVIEELIAVVKRVGTAPSNNCQKKISVKREFLSLRVVARKMNDINVMYKNLAIDCMYF